MTGRQLVGETATALATEIQTQWGVERTFTPAQTIGIIGA